MYTPLNRTTVSGSRPRLGAAVEHGFGWLLHQRIGGLGPSIAKRHAAVVSDWSAAFDPATVSRHSGITNTPDGHAARDAKLEISARLGRETRISPREPAQRVAASKVAAACGRR